MRPLFASLPLALAALAALPAAAAEPTSIAIDGAVPAEPRYSQAVALTMHLTRGAEPVPGSACQNEQGGGQPCRLVVSVAPLNDPAASVVVTDPALDDQGTAVARIAFVDGLYDDDSAFAAASDGEQYVVTVQFLGTVQCTPDQEPVADGELCGDTASVAVFLFPETAEINLGLGVEGGLGDEVVLSAALKDPNGLAEEGGTSVDGPGPLDLEGQEVRFFYDADNDGNAEAAEALDADPATAGVQPAVTNAAGVASMTFLLDPERVRAGEYENGIQAEFGGDGRYGVARAATRLTVSAGDVDPSRTVISPQPASIPNDGFSSSTIVVTLVDQFNNPLDETADEHVVVITTDLGVLEDEVERDLVAGTYSQVLRAQRKAGTATVSVTVDGADAGSTVVEITGDNGCTCASSSTHASLAFVALAFAAGTVRRRSAPPGRRA